MTNIPSNIIKSSAIPAWSGFIYQGKVALYHAIRLILQKDNKAHYLNVEHLDDFVICDKAGNVLSLHQVKAMKSDKRYAYNSALEQASKISERCDENTSRWFHVSVKLEDFSERAANDSAGEHLVKFYQYHDDRYFVETNSIDLKLNEIVFKYLESSELPSTELLVRNKLAKLQVLLAGRVNLAHHRNQHESMNKFEAAESIPIYFSEIVDCLRYEVIDNNDHEAILFNFKKTLLDRTDQIIDSLQKNEEIDLNGICLCRYAIAKMSISTLTRLYFSKKPNQKEITLSGFSTDTVDQYLRIILKIIGIKTSDDLPHYFKNGSGTYLPTAMKFDFINQKLDVRQIQDNVNGLRANIDVQDLLFEFDNLIVHMDSPPFNLDSKENYSGKFTDVSDAYKNRITKINNVRFVSTADASSELND